MNTTEQTETPTAPSIGDTVFLYNSIPSYINGQPDHEGLACKVTSVRRKLFSLVQIGADPLYYTRDFKLEDWGESERGEQFSYVYAYPSKEKRAADFEAEVQRQHKKNTAKEIEQLAKPWFLEKLEVAQLESFLALLVESKKA